MKHIRSKLGLSQSELANLLGIPRSTISISELGMRNLNTRQLATVAQIEILLTDEPAIAANTIVNIKANTALRKKMEKRLENVSFNCIKMKRKLDTLKSNYEKNENLGYIISSLRVEAQKGTAAMAYLDVLEIKYLEKRERYSLDKQTELALNISLLEYEQEALKKIVSG